MRYRLSQLLLLLFIIPISLFARSSQEEETPIAIFLPDSTDGRKHGVALEEKFNQNTYKANIYYSNTQDDQNIKIEESLSEEIKLVIIYSINNDINNITQKIVEHNIQIITYDRLIENNRDYFYYLTFDYEIMGRNLTEKTMQKLTPSDKPYKILLIAEERNRNQELIYTGIIDILKSYIRSGRVSPTVPIDSFKTLSIPTTNELILEAGIDKLLNLGSETPDIILSTDNQITEVVNDKLDLIQPSELLSPNINRFAETAVLLCNQILNETEVLLPNTRHYKTDTELIMVDTYFIDPNF